MADHIIIGKTFTSTTDFLEALLENAAKVGAAAGVEQYKLEQMKNKLLTTGQAAKELGVSVPTVLKYIHEGHKNAGKLPAIGIGNTNKINQFDLEEFKKRR